MNSCDKVRTMLRSPSHESINTDLSLLSVSSLSVGRHLTCKTPVDMQRGPSPNPDVKVHKRPGDVPLAEEGTELLRGCALLCSALGLRRSLSTGDVPRALSPPPAPRCAGSEARLSWAGGGGGCGVGGWLGAASRSCSTWVAVGDSRLPSPHRPAPPMQPPPPADLLQALNNKCRQVYIRRRLMTTYRALERMSHSEFNLDRLEVSRGTARELTLRDVERERGRPLSKYERNMMIFDWLHTLEEGAPVVPSNQPMDQCGETTAC